MERLQDWFLTPLGRALAEAERDAVRRRVRPDPASTVVQLGGFGDRRPTVRLARQFLVDLPGAAEADVLFDGAQLPFRRSSVDALVVVHLLEFIAVPARLLQEAEEVLAPEGLLVVFGFNPLSLWGLRRQWGRLRRQPPPWCGRHLSLGQVAGALRGSSLHREAIEYLYPRPPWGRGRNGASAGLHPALGVFAGGVHMTVARKRVVAPISARALWQRREAPAPGAAQPTARTIVEREGRRARPATG